MKLKCLHLITSFSGLRYLVLCLCWISCASHQHPDKKIFHYNESSGIASLDPAFAKNQSVMWAVHQLYNTLVEVNDSLKTVPSLAKSWEVSADNTVYTFHLRTDVFFQDDMAFAGGKGRRLKAADVVYSFQRILDPRVASPGAWIFNDRVDTLHPFTAINDSTFQLKLLHPFQPITGILSMQYCSIVPREAVVQYGADFRRHPVGTGPFQMVAWEEGQALVLKKNPHYFETDNNGQVLPYLDGVYVSFFDSKATEFLEFQQGKLDFINDIDPSFKDEVLTRSGHLQAAWRDKVVLQLYPYLNTEYFGILSDTGNVLLKHSPLRLQKIRQAINDGFDRRKMILYLRNSIGYPAENGFVPKGLPSFDSSVTGCRYNTGLARRLLAEAGFPDGKGLPVITLLTVPSYADIASYVANELLQIGIKVQVETVQKSVLLEQTARSAALFFRGSWIADYPDAENYLSVFYSKNPAPPNYTRYRNPVFDLLYEKALSEKNDTSRYRLYRQMDQLLIYDAPVVPLWYDEVVRLVQPDIKGFYPNALNLLELRRATKH